MPEYTNLSDVIVDGRIESSAQGGVMGSFAVMPTASALNENCIVLYTGTTGTYVSGRFYMCVGSGSSYSWQPVTISGTEEETYAVNRALISDSSGKVAASGVTSTQLGYLSGVTSPIQTQINNKVSVVSGMGLSQNSYTTAEKNKLAGIESGADVNVIETIRRNGSNLSVSGKAVNITVPTALSDLTNDEGFITSTVNNLTNYYTRTQVDNTFDDYYTKSQVNSLVNAIPKFTVQVVSTLPSSGQSTSTIYLVPSDDSEAQDVYEEYLWVNRKWEKIGSTAVSFSLTQNSSGISINGTSLQTATASRTGLMTSTSYSQLSTARSNITNLQSQYSSLNGTVSSLSSRLDTAESTLSTTASRVSTAETDIESLQTEIATAKNNGVSKLDLTYSGTTLTGKITKVGGGTVSDSVTISTGKKSLYTGSIDNLITYTDGGGTVDNRKLTVNKEFMIEYIETRSLQGTATAIVPAGTYTNVSHLGGAIICDGVNVGDYHFCFIRVSTSGAYPMVNNRTAEQITSSTMSESNGECYRLFT